MRQTIIACVMFFVAMTVHAQKQIEILHTNDTHSCIMPLSRNLADTVVAGRGGYIRRAAMIAQERETCPELLLFDSGDFSQGSSYYTLFHGEVEVCLMNAMGYDAVTIGNHEFDFGLDNMATLFRMAEFPVVCANYDFAGTPVEGLVDEYVVIERDGLRIGVFGICPELDGLVDKKLCEGVVFLDPVETANRVANTLRYDLECDLVVCLSHLGWSDDANDADGWLISSTRDIDIVLGGHSHTYFDELRYVDNADGNPVPDDQNGKHGVYVGKILLDFDK